jgi:iron complex transport system substrate-binding protein
MTADRYPRRIVCLTEETTETLYLLGEGDRVVGVSGYTVRPPEARRKPRVSAFTPRALREDRGARADLVLAFSDLQSDIAAELARRGYTVMLFNQRSVAEILQMILIVGGLVGQTDRAAALVAELEAGLDEVRTRAGRLRRGRASSSKSGTRRSSRASAGWKSSWRSRAAIRSFPSCATPSWARIGSSRPTRSCGDRPDVIVASWCGKTVRPERIRSRTGWDTMPAVHRGQIYEIKSPLILQPGPAALTDGLHQLHQAIAAAASCTP